MHKILWSSVQVYVLLLSLLLCLVSVIFLSEAIEATVKNFLECFDYIEQDKLYIWEECHDSHGFDQRKTNVLIPIIVKI